MKPDIVNAISHYDDYALQELENKKCLKKDCDGILEDYQNEEDDDDKQSTSTGLSQE